MQHTRIAKNKRTYLFALRLGYAYGVSDKSMASPSVQSIPYPESSGFLVSGRRQERLWGNGCSGLFTVTKLRTVNRRIPAVTIPLSQSLSWRRPLTKKPEDSGYEIDVQSYFIGYFDAVDSDYFSQRREMSDKILAKGLHFPVLLHCNLSNNECDKSIRH